jgi:hypothetical protein
MATIRKRSKLEAAQTDQTCTPKFLADLLPLVDLDPASNSRSHIRARWAYSLEKGLDGLKLPWRGTVFINWPFSFPEPFAEKAIHEMTIGNCTDLIVLCKLDTGTEWYRTITSRIPGAPGPLSRPPERWDFHKRVQYDEHPDVIEQRRLERVAEFLARERSPRSRKTVEDITGESSTNFCSTIIHRRGDGMPALDLGSVAQRWLMMAP